MKPSLISFLSVVFILGAQGSWAGGDSQYCVNRVDQRLPEDLKLEGSKNTPTSVATKRAAFEVNGRRYTVSAYGDQVSLHGPDGHQIKRIRAPQYQDGPVHGIVMHQNGWLWIDGIRSDYSAWIDLNKSPALISEPQPISNLHESPCHPIAWLAAILDGGCKPAGSYYSRTLNKVYIKGYKYSWFGFSDLVNLEISQGHEKIMPTDVGEILNEVPTQGGVLLNGRPDEVVFYDGKSITKYPLMIQSAPDNPTGGPVRSEIPWRLVEMDYSDKKFITNLQIRGKEEKPFMYGFIANSGLKKIELPAGVENVRSVFGVGSNERAFWVGNGHIYGEIDGRLIKAVSVENANAIILPAGKALGLGRFYFNVFNRKRSTSKDWEDHPIAYVLTESKINDRCDFPLRFPKAGAPLMLEAVGTALPQSVRSK